MVCGMRAEISAYLNVANIVSKLLHPIAEVEIHDLD